jgi:hypothetical protein
MKRFFEVTVGRQLRLLENLRRRGNVIGECSAMREADILVKLKGNIPTAKDYTDPNPLEGDNGS